MKKLKKTYRGLVVLISAMIIILVWHCWLCIMYGDSSVIKISGQKIINEKDGKSYFYNIRLLSKRGIYRFCPEGEW